MSKENVHSARRHSKISPMKRNTEVIKFVDSAERKTGKGSSKQLNIKFTGK